MKFHRILSSLSLILSVFLLCSCNWPSPMKNNSANGGAGLNGCLASSTATSTAIQTPDAALGIENLAQSFETPNSEATITQASLLLNVTTPVGITPIGGLVVRIEEDSGGSPDSNYVVAEAYADLSGGSVNAGVVSPTTFALGTAQFYTFTFNKVTLQPSSTYWLVLTNTDSTTGVTVEWLASQSNPYSAGQAKYSVSDGSWITGSFGSKMDLAFGIGCQ